MLIEGQDLESAMPRALANSNKLGRHSGVYTFSQVGDQVLTTRYVWADRDFRPWGQTLPAQCPVCGSPQRWKRKYRPGADESAMYEFSCRYMDCGKDLVTGLMLSPRGHIVVRKPQGVKFVPLTKGNCSGWLSVVIP